MFYGYLRVSTEQQLESGAGLDAQRIACQKIVGDAEIQFFSDRGVSGKTGLDKRPMLLEIISLLKKDDVVLVAKRDRLGRDPISVAMIDSAIKRKHARIISVAGEGTGNDDPGNILMRRLVDAFAEYERLVIGARTKAALQAKKMKCERVGYIPFGMQLSCDGRHLEPSQGEAATLRIIEQYRDSGLSLRKIADTLNKNGVTKRNGQPWNQVNLHTIVNRDGYGGNQCQ